MKINQKIAIGIIMASCLISCVGNGTINQKVNEQLLNSPQSQQIDFSSAMMTSGEFDNIQDEDTMYNLVINQVQSAKALSDTVVSFNIDCDKGWRGIDIDLSANIIKTNNLNDWGAIIRYLNYKVSSYNVDVKGSLSVNRDTNKLVFYVSSIAPTRMSCRVSYSPEYFPMNKVLKLTQSTGATTGY